MTNTINEDDEAAKSGLSVGVFMSIPSPVLKRIGVVTFPVSYKYNGGILIGGKYYDGFSVGNPIISRKHELVSMGVGLDMNSYPPVCTMLLRKKENKCQ